MANKQLKYEANPPNLNYYVQKFNREIIDSSANVPIAKWKWDSQLVSIFHDKIIDGIKYPNYYSYSLPPRKYT